MEGASAADGTGLRHGIQFCKIYLLYNKALLSYIFILYIWDLIKDLIRGTGYIFIYYIAYIQS